MSVVDAEMIGGPMDGAHYRMVCPPASAGGDGGPLLLVSFFAHPENVALLPAYDEDTVEVVEVRYQRQMLPHADGSWRYRYVPPTT